MRPLGFGAAAVLLGLACSPAGLLSDLETQAHNWSESFPAPQISVTPGGPYRDPGDVSTVVLTGPSTADAVFFTTDGSAPTFTSGGGSRSSSTQRIDGGSITWDSVVSPLVTLYGTTTLRAVAWRSGGRRSAEASQVFRVLGPGGLVWSQSPLGGGTGDIRAVAVASDGTVYTAGTADRGGETVGFVMHLSAAGTVLEKLYLDHASQINGLAIDSTDQVLVAGSLDVAGTHTLAALSRVTTKATQGFYAGLSADLATANYFKVLTLSSRLRAMALFGAATVLVAGGVYESGTVSIDSLNISAPKVSSNAVAFGFTPLTGTALVGSVVGSSGSLVKDEFTALAVNGSTAVAVGWLDSTSAGSSITYVSKNAVGSTSGKVPLAVGFQPATWAVDFAWPASASAWIGGAEARAVAYDASGNPLVGGVAVGAATVEGFSGASAGNNAFLVSLSSSGLPQSVSGPLPVSAAADSELDGLIRTADGQIFGVGSVGPAPLLWGAMEFDGGASRSPFLLEVWSGSADPALPGRRWIAQNTDAKAGFLALGSDGSSGAGLIYIGGEAAGSTSLDWGNGSEFTYPGSGTVPLLSQHYF